MERQKTIGLKDYVPTEVCIELSVCRSVIFRCIAQNAWTLRIFMKKIRKLYDAITKRHQQRTHTLRHAIQKTKCLIAMN